MMSMAQIPPFEQDKLNLRAKKFMMWLFIVTSFILFAGLTSAFIVYTAGNPNRGIKVILPQLFIYSTAVIILSSITLHMAYYYAKRLKLGKQKLYLAATIVLGILFFIMQLGAWQTLIDQGVYFVNQNASQSFIYVFTGMHLLHILAGLVMVINSYAGAVKRIHKLKNIFRLEVTSIFWHFIDILWIYLYFFLI